jgi:hypothetical protein
MMKAKWRMMGSFQVQLRAAHDVGIRRLKASGAVDQAAGPELCLRFIRATRGLEYAIRNGQIAGNTLDQDTEFPMRTTLLLSALAAGIAFAAPASALTGGPSQWGPSYPYPSCSTCGSSGYPHRYVRYHREHHRVRAHPKPEASK